ncbi:ubiquitin carboxyl-terminal hydrolase 7-like [Styela clava]
MEENTGQMPDPVSQNNTEPCLRQSAGNVGLDAVVDEVEKMETEDVVSQVTENGGEMIGNGSISENDIEIADDKESIEDTDDEFGFCKSEATFSFSVPNVHKLSESVTSPKTFIRGLPWKILIMPRSHPDRTPGAKSLGYFLQCNADNDSSSWSCHGAAELRILPAKKGGEMLEKKISHIFHCKENDWGFSNFLPWSDLINPEKGFITPEKSLTFEVHCFADAPHGVAWDSRKLTGYIGLKNQGATCYMNSVLQTLFFTSKLRKAVYLMPTESDDSMKSVSLALQRVFYDLQHSDKPVGTKKLTKSFGWETLDSFMQHDVQEFCRVLIDNLESKMKGTCVEGTIPGLFRGTMTSYVKCKFVNYVSSREESFYDIQLSVKGHKNILESLREYVKPETLDGDNKFDAGENGMQEAEKGVTFKTFPPVLHLQLLRFHYDPITDMNIKINDRYEFFEKLELDEFLEVPDSADKATYILHAVLVHSGDNHGGHYVAYLNPVGDGKWCKFDDDVVSRCTKKEAFHGSFGGRDEESFIGRHSTNAYMLVYIRENKLSEVLCPISDKDVPENLVNRLSDEREVEAYRRKERAEAHLYMTVNVITEDQFWGHQAEDLFDVEHPFLTRTFRARRQQSYDQFMDTLADSFGYPRSHIRIWPLTQRQNSTLRPCTLDEQEARTKPLFEIADGEVPWNLWLEVLHSDSDATALPPFDKDGDVLLFAKMYLPTYKCIAYCGHLTVPISGTKMGDLEVELRKRGGLLPDTPLLLFEEIQPSHCSPIKDKSLNLGEAMDKLMDGNIIVFQVDSPDNDNSSLPTAKAFYRDLYHRVEVIFCNKNDPSDPGFLVSLSHKMTYNQMAVEVAKRIDADPTMLQFFRMQTVREIPGAVIRSHYEGQLKDLLQIYGSRKLTKKLYYQELSMKVGEFENKRQFRCVYVSPKLKEEELLLYINKNSDVASLLMECKKKMSLPPEQDVRLLEVVGNKIFTVMRPESSTELIAAHNPATRVYRIEQIPPDQKELAEDEILINVVHYNKEIYQTFGVPFLIKIKTGERYKQIKERIRNVLDDKDFEKWKISVVMQGQARVINEETDIHVNVKDLISPSYTTQVSSICNKAWIGLDHVNKAPKRHTGRFGYLEKAIKIHN